MNTKMAKAYFLTVTVAAFVAGPSKGFANDGNVDTAKALPTASKHKGQVIEEILVTAQRRAQHLQDVPISMSAFDNSFLQQQGVTDLEDVSLYVPNVRIDMTGTSILPRIRGFSTNTVVNRGLSLPVGIVIDEVPYSRADYFVTGLFDIQRVEVLRGPQGQLFGANTTVGLLNLITQNPTDEFIGSIGAESGEFDYRRFQAALGGPLLSDRINFRIAALSENRDGYVKNTTARTDPAADSIFGGRSRESYRAKLDFPNILAASLLITYQSDTLDFGSPPSEFTSVPERWHDLIRAYDPNADFEPGNFVGSYETTGFRKTDIETLTAIARYDMGGWGLNLVAGWSELESTSRDDADYSPLPLNNVDVIEASRQSTVEIRVASPTLEGLFGLDELLGVSMGQTEFTAGVFAQRREQVPTTAVTFLNVPLVVFLESFSSDGGLPVPALTPPDKWEFFAADFFQTAEEKAAYGQMNWYFLERWMLLAGIRVSRIDKDAEWIQENGAEDGACCLLDALVPTFTGTASNTERHTAPKVGMKFDWTENVNFYATWSEGFQPGGFNNYSNSGSLESRTVEPALVESWEAGSKMLLLDGTAELNVGLFWMTMEDFQLFTVAPVPGGGLFPVAQVVNVGEVRARGAEVDGTWLPTHWLSLRAAVGYNDTEYLKFPIGTCFSDRENTDGDDEPRCDLSGQPFEQAPRWEASFTPGINLPISAIPGVPASLDDIALTGALGVQYTDDRFLNEANDPRTQQPAYFLLSASLGIANASQGWSIQIRVKNLTDKRYHSSSREALPISGGVNKFASPPRTVLGSLRYDF